MGFLKALRNDVSQLVLVTTAVVGFANFLLGCLDMVGWARRFDGIAQSLLVFSLPYAALGLLFAIAIILGLMRRLRACLAVAGVALIASAALFACDIAGWRDSRQVLLPGLGQPCRVFWWWYDPSPAPPGQDGPVPRASAPGKEPPRERIAVPPATGPERRFRYNGIGSGTAAPGGGEKPCRNGSSRA